MKEIKCINCGIVLLSVNNSIMMVVSNIRFSCKCGSDGIIEHIATQNRDLDECADDDKQGLING